jgi:hypothetical protein
MIFEEITIEEDPQYEAYQLQLELQQYLESDEHIRDVNFELQEVGQKQRDLKSVDFIV